MEVKFDEVTHIIYFTFFTLSISFDEVLLKEIELCRITPFSTVI